MLFRALPTRGRLILSALFPDSEEIADLGSAVPLGHVVIKKLMTWKENGDKDAVLGCVLL